MTTATPITALAVLTDMDELTETATTYAAMADELASMVECSPQAHTIAGRIVIHRLAALHVELDDLTVTTPTHRHLVRLFNEVDELRLFLLDQDGPIFDALARPLDELYGALVREARAAMTEGRA